MHLAPKIDHDTHSKTYGRRVDGRTAVWIDGDLTRLSLVSALARRHCYATEDRNLTIVAAVNGTHLPGDRLGQAETLQIDVSMRDPDEPDATYVVRLYRGFMGDDEAPAEIKDVRATREGDGAVTVRLAELSSAPGFYVVKVEQKSGDPPCGQNDDAWLAPVWVNELLQDDALVDSYAFVGSKHTKVYHDPRCADIARIRPENRVHFSLAPEGRRLHDDCPRIADEE